MKLFKILSLFVLPIVLFAWKMESGTITLPATTAGSSTWQTINFQQTYDTVPLVFALVDQGSGYTGDTPVIVRIKNVSTTSVDIVQVEAQSMVEAAIDQGPHPSVNVHYLVIEAGDYTLVDGTRILAGIHTTMIKEGKNITGTKGWDTVTFPSAFAATPSILAMVQSVQNETATLPGVASVPWLTSGVSTVTASSVDLTLERAETSTGTISSNEDIAYLAIDAGKQGTLFDTESCLAIPYETQTTGDSIRGWDNSCLDISFLNAYNTNPLVLGSMNRRDGGDGGWLRRCSLTTTSVGLTIDEDQAADSERRHTTESAGLVIFGQNFVYDSTKVLACKVPVVDYRMDECYWLDSAGGVISDVKDSGKNHFHATSSGVASIIQNTGVPPLCNYGNFTAQPDLVDTNDGTAGDTAAGITVSVWLKPAAMTNWQAIVTKSKAYNWNDGWGLAHYSGQADTEIRFFVNDYFNNSIIGTLTLNTWNHVVATYDNTTMRLYINGTEVSNLTYSASIINSAVTDPIRIAYDDNRDDEYIGGVDELKVWDKALTAAEVLTIYDNESKSKSFDGTPRVCPTCEGNLTAATWGLVGIPADLRTAANKDVADVFDEFPGATYATRGDPNDWVVFKRDYNAVTNASSYSIVPYTGVPLENGKGYWILSSVSKVWSENGLPTVDYNSTNPACVTNACIEIDLLSPNKNFGAPDFDPDDGTGPYRNNMLGFVGHVPVDWADCRIVVSDANGTISYTPSGAATAGYADKQIWQYNPGANNANSNGYTTCDDTIPGGCKLEPYKGFWVRLNGTTKGKSVKLLIPKAK